METSVAISVVIPVYNVQDYIERCVRSIMNQTFKDIEIIVVNDASHDQSMEVVYKLQKADERIKVIHNETNKGAGISRNAGMKQAKGDCIYFMDSDDWLDRTALETTYKALKEHDADFVEFNTRMFEENKQVMCTHFRTGVFNKEQYFGEFSKTIAHFAIWNKLYSLEFLKSIALAFQNLTVHHDGLFNLEACCYVNKVVIIKDTLYNYVINFNSLTYGSVGKEKIKSSVEFLKRLSNILQREELLFTPVHKGLHKIALDNMRWWYQRYEGQDIDDLLLLYFKEVFGEEDKFAYSLFMQTREMEAYRQAMHEYFGDDAKQYEMYYNVKRDISDAVAEKKLRSDDRVIIYGTGEWGRRNYKVLKEVGVNIIAFSDSNPERWHSTFCETIIIPPQDIQTTDYSRVLIASSAYLVIRQSLLDMGIDDNRIMVFGF